MFDFNNIVMSAAMAGDQAIKSSIAAAELPERSSGPKTRTLLYGRALLYLFHFHFGGLVDFGAKKQSGLEAEEKPL